MKKLKTYTAENIYKHFKKEEICFVIAYNYDWIDESSSPIDNLEDAIQTAKEEDEDNQIFIFTRKKCIDCFDPDSLFQDLICNLENEGMDSDYTLDCIRGEGEKEFHKITTEWFKKQFGNTYIFDECLGVLEE